MATFFHANSRGELLATRQSRFAWLLIMATFAILILLFTTVFLWIIEFQNLKRLQVFSAQVAYIGEHPAGQTVVRFSDQGTEVLKRLKFNSAPAGTQVGDRFEILYNGTADPFPSLGFGLHIGSPITGLLCVVMLTITLVGRVIWRNVYRIPFRLTTALSNQYNEGKKLYHQLNKLGQLQNTHRDAKTGQAVPVEPNSEDHRSHRQ